MSRIRLSQVSLLGALMLLGASSGAHLRVRGAEAAQPAPLRNVMQVKLDYAQSVLRALATEDFAALERAATQLGALTKQASWGVLKTPEYGRHSADFLREADNLAASARAGDLNGATLDYAALVFRCVQCHRHVKGVRQAN